MPLGLYLSVPFCKTKCSYCNFASGVFSPQMVAGYLDRLEAEMQAAPAFARSIGARFDRSVDSVYLGGGTPSMLLPEQLRQLFASVHRHFDVQPQAEITVECAPGTLGPEMLEALLSCGVNRVSLGVQSFIDQESRSVARLHTRDITLTDIEQLRAAGIHAINVDLIAGLPHQTADSWSRSLDDAIASQVPHVSVYMLEVDEDSRLGRELIAGGTRYHAHHVPDDELTADLYLEAIRRLNATGIGQYEISNFARPSAESRHNLKYWTRQPYLGFGVDAHSMLLSDRADYEALRYATADTLENYLAAAPPTVTGVTINGAFEETFFLGLRLNRGVDLHDVLAQFGLAWADAVAPTLSDLEQLGLLEQQGTDFRLTDRGRLLSNEVFARFLGDELATARLPLPMKSEPAPPQLITISRSSS